MSLEEPGPASAPPEKCDVLLLFGGFSRGIYTHIPKPSPPFLSRVTPISSLLVGKSQIQGYLSILLDAAEWASPFILFSFQLLDTWLNSQKDNERERAMWCTARILGFTAKMNNFKVSGACPGVWALMPPLVALIPTFIPNFIIYIT